MVGHVTRHVTYEQRYKAGKILSLVSDDKDVAEERHFGLDTALDRNGSDILPTTGYDEFWKFCIQ